MNQRHIGIPGTGTRASIIASIEQSAATIGFTIPAKVEKAFAAHRQMVARGNILLAGDTIALATAIVDALEVDADPIDEARHHVLTAAVTQQATPIRAEISKREKGLVREHRDTIIDAARKAIVGAHNALTTAAQQVPNLDPRSTPEQVLRSGPGASLWQAAKSAQSSLGVYTAMLKTLGYRLNGDSDFWMHVAPQLLDRDALRSEWDAVRGGATLDLIHPTEVGARVEQVNNLHREREQAKQQAALAARQRTGSKPIADAFAKKYAEADAAT